MVKLERGGSGSNSVVATRRCNEGTSSCPQIGQVEQSERHVRTVVGEDAGCNAARILGGCGFCERSSKIAQGTQAPLAENAACVLNDSGENPVNRAVRTADRAK
jgi:hypothetical protein